jgi:hypothetical protein
MRLISSFRVIHLSDGLGIFLLSEPRPTSTTAHTPPGLRMLLHLV